MVDGDGVSDADLAEVFNGGDEVAGLADADVGDLGGLGGVFAEFGDGEGAAHLHHADFVADLEFAVEDAAVEDDASVVVVDGVEDEGAGLVGGGLAGRGHLLADDGEEFVDALACFGGDGDAVFGGEAEHLFDFFGDLDGACGGEVDLVEDGDEFEVLLDGEVGVDDGLGLDALGGVDDEEGAFAGFEGAGDFVAEIDVAGRVDEVEHELFAVVDVFHGDGGGLDGDASFAFEVHGIEEAALWLHGRRRPWCSGGAGRRVWTCRGRCGR